MTPLETAIFICGTQTELARRVTGKPASGHVYHWRKNGFSEDVAIAIERAQRAAVLESEEAANRAREVGGVATVEMLRPDRDWIRSPDGQLVEYRVRVDVADHGRAEDEDGPVPELRVLQAAARKPGAFADLADGVAPVGSADSARAA